MDPILSQMKTQAETRLAAKQSAETGPPKDAANWARFMSGENPPKFLTNQGAHAVINAAVDHCRGLQDKLAATQRALASATSAKAAPANPSTPPAAAKTEAKAPTPASNLTGLAKVAAAFKAQSKKN